MIDFVAVKKALESEKQSLTASIDRLEAQASSAALESKAFRFDANTLKKQRKTCETALRGLADSAFDRAVADLAAIDSNRENER